MKPNLFLLSLFFAIFCSLSITAQTPEINIAGKTVAVINKGDVLNPMLSPDATQLAYSRSVSNSKGWQLSEISVRNLKTNRTIILLTPKSSEKYGSAGGNFVSSLEWLDNNRLVAYLADGDVGTDILTFNVRTRRIIKTKHTDAGDDNYEVEYPPNYKATLKNINAISPSIPKEAIEIVLQYGTGAFTLEKRGMVLQYAYQDVDNNIHFYDFINKKEKILLDFTDGKYGEAPQLIGGFRFGEKIIFALDCDGVLRILEHANNQTKILIEQKIGEPRGAIASLIVKKQTPGRILFFTRPGDFTGEIKGTLWVFDKNGLRKTNDLGKLLDVDVKGNLIAYSHWIDAETHGITVKELKP